MEAARMENNMPSSHRNVGAGPVSAPVGRQEPGLESGV